MVIIDGVSFGTRLKEARIAARATQQAVADACGLTDKAVSAWENGQTDSIIAANLFKVADFLGVDPRWLALGEGQAPAPRSALDEIVEGLEELPVEQQEAVRALIASLRK